MPAMTPEDQQMMQKAVMAAQKIMYDKSVFPMFAKGMAKPGPLPLKLATEAAGLLKMLQDKAQGQIPKRLAIPIGMMIMLEMADFMEKSKLAQPKEVDIKNAMKLLIDMIPKIFKGGGQPAPQQDQPAQPQAPTPPQGGGGLINQQPQMAGA